MPKFQELEVSLDQLVLDPNNYRFRDDPDFRPVPERKSADEGVQRKVRARLRDEALNDLKASIMANGFLPIERIITRFFRTEKTKANGDEKKRDLFLVLEGNRRVASLKWIVEDKESGYDVPKEVQSVFEKVPILILEEDGDEPAVYEAIMGIRHVSGIKEWGGYQRAQLISSLCDVHELESQEIAERLGMSVREVNRRYKAYKVLAQMQEDDDLGEHATAKLYPIFHEAVALPGVRRWLGWSDEKAQFLNQDELEQFYEWITPHAEEGELIEPKISSHRDVRDLPAILDNAEALAILKDPNKNFSDAVTVAKREQLTRAWRGQVVGAISALKSISAIELVDLAEEDVKLLGWLKQAVDTTLSSYAKLSK